MSEVAGTVFVSEVRALVGGAFKDLRGAKGHVVQR